MKAKLLIAMLASLFCIACSSPKQEIQYGQREILFQKLFPFTYALETEAKDIIAGDASLAGIGTKKYEALLAEEDASLSPELAKISEEEASVVGERLADLAPQMKKIIDNLRASGKYNYWEALPDGDFIKEIWRADAKAMNKIIDVYALGVKPRYAGIDSIDFKTNGGEIRYVRSDVRYNVLQVAKGRPFYTVTLETALDWLDANDRSEAADFEPMAEGINKASYAAIKTVNWDNYPYSVILVLGSGPEKSGQPISAQSRLRAQYAAQMYKEGKAPFIVVSGGRVHPFKTPYSEAEQMKKYLMEIWSVPESAIIAEPHARHTTTNIRNTVRIMLEQGIPMDKKGLITSGSSHIDYVCGDYFQGVCTREMWIMPFTKGDRLNPRTTEFLPHPSAAFVNTLEDPLDP